MPVEAEDLVDAVLAHDGEVDGVAGGQVGWFPRTISLATDMVS
jgi:hypothetical protein